MWLICWIFRSVHSVSILMHVARVFDTIVHPFTRTLVEQWILGSVLITLYTCYSNVIMSYIRNVTIISISHVIIRVLLRTTVLSQVGIILCLSWHLLFEWLVLASWSMLNK
jgi:hypothetical protein